MKILTLDPAYRYWLNARSALRIDSGLNENFAGLTHDDSVFFAEMTSEPLTTFNLWDMNTISRFLRLYERHELVLDFHKATGNFMAE